MKSLLRNPLFRLLLSFAWLPPLALFFTWNYGSPAALEAGFRIVGILATFFACVFGIALMHTALRRSRVRRGRQRRQERVLCPGCLEFGGFRYACPECGQEIPEDIALLPGFYVRDCPHCEAPLFGRSARALRAYCGRCGRDGERELWHGHRIRVVAALLSDDYLALCRRLGADRAQSSDRLTWREDPAARTLILNLSAWPEQKPPTADHVLRHIDTLWLSEADIDLLLLGQVCDRFLRLAGQTGDAPRFGTLHIAQQTLSPMAKNLLSPRFRILLTGISVEQALELPASERSEERDVAPQADILPSHSTSEERPLTALSVSERSRT